MNQFLPRIFLLLIMPMLASVTATAQLDSGKDSLVRITDSSTIIVRDSSGMARPDSLRTATSDSAAIPFVQPKPDTSLQQFYRLNPYIDTDSPPIYQPEEFFSPKEKDFVFYVLASLLIVLGFIRLIFSKYFNDLFRIFFKTTFRQKSIREQLQQNKMASLMLNIFFFISGGLFLYFVANYKGWLIDNHFIEKGLLCIALVGVVYTTKYITLQICGWLFGMPDVIETYLFIVFLINKVVGVLLLPAIIILALGTTELRPIFLVVSILVLGILYFYRYVVALPLVRNHSGLTGFHFFVYLCAFEVVPVLIIYKLLLLILSR